MSAFADYSAALEQKLYDAAGEYARKGKGNWLPDEIAQAVEDRDFTTLLKKVPGQTMGYWFQNGDLDLLARAGAPVHNFGKDPGPDGIWRNLYIQYKTARPAQSTDVCVFSDVAGEGTGVANLLLAVDWRLAVDDWATVFGTAEELRVIGSELRKLNPNRKVTVSESSTGRWEFHLNPIERVLAPGKVPGVYRFSDFINHRVV